MFEFILCWMSDHYLNLSRQDSLIKLGLGISLEFLTDCLHYLKFLILVPYVYVGHNVIETGVYLELDLDILRGVHYQIFDSIVVNSLHIFFKLLDQEDI